MLEDFASGVSAIGGSLFLPVQNQMMEEDRNQRQEFNATQASWDREFQATQAQMTRDWQTEMSNTSYRRAVADMNAAGINPMLLIQKAGGASTPAGATATGAMATTGGTAGYPSTGSPMPFFQNVASAAQAQLNEAATKKTEAETDYIKAQTGAVPVNIEATQAQIQRTRAEVEKLIQDTKTSTATAANIEQNTINLKAALPIMEETVKNLRALTTLHGEQANLAFKQAGLTQQQGEKLQQEITANLPKLEAAYLELKTQHSQLGLQESKAMSQAYTTKGGTPDALLAFLRSLPIPFANSLPMRNY